MAVVTGVMSSATPGLAMYNLLAAALAANPNWSRPASNQQITGATDSLSATATTEIWKCTVGSQVFFVAFSTDTALPNNLYMQAAEAYDGSDGGGAPGAKRFRRHSGKGSTAASADGTSIAPGATDVTTATDTAIPAATWPQAKLTFTGSAFPYLFKVTNKTVTVGAIVSSANIWLHVGSFESLVTGPPDPIPLALFGHPTNSPANWQATVGTTVHADGHTARNPGLGTTAETGAFYNQLRPLHAPGGAFDGNEETMFNTIAGYNVAPPRWYTKALMSQMVIHQSRQAGVVNAQPFRGYYPDLFGAIINGTTEPQGGGVDSVIIDGVQYYWLGLANLGSAMSSTVSLVSNLVAIRAD